MAVSLVAACKGKPKPQAAPGSGRVETQGSSTADKDIILPHSDGSPPVKTTAPVKPETFKKLSEMTFTGFNLDTRAVNDKHMWVYQKITGSPVIRASIHIWPCDEKNCFKADLDTYKAHEADLKSLLTDGLKKAPDTIFEYGKTDLNGAPAMYTFQLGQVVGGEHNEFSYAYILYYNDGVNEIRSLAEYKDDLVKTKEDMVKLVPRTDLENIAKAFADAYTHHWQE